MQREKREARWILDILLSLPLCIQHRQAHILPFNLHGICVKKNMANKEEKKIIELKIVIISLCCLFRCDYRDTRKHSLKSIT